MWKLSVKCMIEIDNKKNDVIFIILFILFLIITVTPDILIPAAIAGMHLWALRVVPGLIIGIIFVGCFNYYMPPDLSWGEIIIIVCSIMSGFPTGALICMQYYKSHRNSDVLPSILAFCNISSPGFTVNYIYYGLLQEYITLPALLLCVYTPVVLLIGYEYIYKYCIKGYDGIHIKRHIKRQTRQIKYKYNEADNISFANILNSSINNAVSAILKLGAYIICFSCMCAYIEYIFGGCSIIKLLISGLLEITNGLYMIAAANITAQLKLIIILVVNAFGGISTIMQTSGILKDNCCTFDIRQYIKQKLKLSIVTAMVTIIITLII